MDEVFNVGKTLLLDGRAKAQTTEYRARRNVLYS